MIAGVQERLRRLRGCGYGDRRRTRRGLYEVLFGRPWRVGVLVVSTAMLGKYSHVRLDLEEWILGLHIGHSTTIAVRSSWYAC